MINLSALPIVASEFMTERKQVRFTTSKKKRKVKKMFRNPRCWADVPRADCFILDGQSIVCHPSMLAKVREALAPKFTYAVSMEAL